METFKSEADIRMIARMAPVVVIDVFTQWCGPCKTMAPILDELEEEFLGKVKFIKVDVTDGPPQWVIDMRISSVPTIIFIKNGGIMSIETGWRDKNGLVAKLMPLL